jgi:hypothetical protein
MLKILIQFQRWVTKYGFFPDFNLFPISWHPGQMGDEMIDGFSAENEDLGPRGFSGGVFHASSPWAAEIFLPQGFLAPHSFVANYVP